MAIIINNSHGGTVNIFAEDAVSKAKDTLLNRMYFARNSENVIGGRQGWMRLLELYYSGKYEEMKTFIQNCHGRCGTRRKEMLRCIDIIMEGGNN